MPTNFEGATLYGLVERSLTPLSAHRRPPGDPWLYLILLFAFILRSYHLAYPAWDYHNWRQTITLMIARDYARHGFPLLHPQVAWLGNGPSDPHYFSAEFSIQSVLAALIYKMFRESDVVARLVTITFSLFGIYCLYDLLKRRAGRVTARTSAFIYAVLPYHLFFGRVFMPDIPALALALAGLDVLDHWTENRRPGFVAAASVLSALAILQKPRMILMLLPALYLFWSVYGSSLLKRRAPYGFLLIACVPELAWYMHSVSIQAHTAVSAFNIPHEAFVRQLDLWLQGTYLRRIVGALAFDAFSPLGFGLALAGFLLPMRSRAVWLCRWWIAGAALVLVPIPAVIPDNLYYLSMLLPGGAGLAGLVLSRLQPYLRGTILAVFAGGAIYSALPLFEPDRMPHDLGIILNRLTDPADLVATEAGGSPNVLYFADRRGWLLERAYDLDRVEHLKHTGARYYADTFLGDYTAQRAFFRAMDVRFGRLTEEDAPWQIYDLAATPGPLRTGTGEIPAPQTVNFADQIEFRGVLLRRLLGWPASFEVIYNWRCVKTPAADLRVFVHITNQAGQAVAQQDHWPQAGRFPTTKWRAGDIVRERYVLVLPTSLPPARYQMRIGWFDPLRGSRLPILSSAASDEATGAKIAEIDAPPPPTYGWLSPD